MKKVILISYEGDYTAELVANSLKKINQDYQLIDISIFPFGSQGTIDYSLSNPTPVFYYDGIEIRFEDIKSIWWRRPFGKIKETPNTSMNKYIRMESDVFIRSLFYLLPKGVIWVSDPDNTRIANSKPLQLKIANEVGIKVPKTIISNRACDVKRFIFENPNMEMIMKPVGSSFVEATEKEGGNRAIYARIIDKKKILANIERVSNCPVIFQEAITNKVDLRSTVVGESVFTASITHSVDLGAGTDNLDWRHHKLERIYKPYDLPEEIQSYCVEIVKRLGLNFGVIDLCVSDTGEYFFFEVNPQGQWVPSQSVAGLPISESLAKLLAG